MAKATLHPAFSGLSGAQGGLVYRQVRGQTVVARRAEPGERKPSAAQIVQRERFTAAGHYMREVLADPWQRRVYEALARAANRRTDKLVAGDFLNPPVVEEVDVSAYQGRPGDLIRVLATDDVEVVSVHVALRTRGGARVEEGPATKVHGVWRYAATAAAPAGQPLLVTATATDRPGHTGSATVSYLSP